MVASVHTIPDFQTFHVYTLPDCSTCSNSLSLSESQFKCVNGPFKLRTGTFFYWGLQKCLTVPKTFGVFSTSFSSFPMGSFELSKRSGLRRNNDGLVRKDLWEVCLSYFFFLSLKCFWAYLIYGIENELFKRRILMIWNSNWFWSFKEVIFVSLNQEV